MSACSNRPVAVFATPLEYVYYFVDDLYVDVSSVEKLITLPNHIVKTMILHLNKQNC